MRTRAAHHCARSVLRALFALLALAGCRSGDGGPVGPPSEAALFARLWPNEDGRAWTFDYERSIAAEPLIEELQGLLDATPSEIDYRDLERRLTGSLPEAGETEQVGILTLRFSGTIQTLDGPKQNLESDFVATKDGSTAMAPASARLEAVRGPWHERVALRGTGAPIPALPNGPSNWPPFDLFDSRFEKQTNWIGLYGGARADSSFTILRGPLEEGTFFRHQIAPDVADDFWEYGWVVGPRSVRTPAGRFDAIGIVYFIDLGTLEQSPPPFGSGDTLRVFSISSLYLVPDVGPVYYRTIDYFGPPDLEDATGDDMLFSEVALREYGIP